jgi:alanyl-tRNA synthetase
MSDENINDIKNNFKVNELRQIASYLKIEIYVQYKKDNLIKEIVSIIRKYNTDEKEELETFIDSIKNAEKKIKKIKKNIKEEKSKSNSKKKEKSTKRKSVQRKSEKSTPNFITP